MVAKAGGSFYGEFLISYTLLYLASTLDALASKTRRWIGVKQIEMWSTTYDEYFVRLSDL